MASGISSSFSVGAGTSVALAAANSARTYLLVVNNDAVNSVWVAFGSGNTATVAKGIQIPAGGHLELGPVPLGVGDVTSTLPTSDVAAITAGGTVSVTVLES